MSTDDVFTFENDREIEIDVYFDNSVRIGQVDLPGSQGISSFMLTLETASQGTVYKVISIIYSLYVENM